MRCALITAAAILVPIAAAPQLRHTELAAHRLAAQNCVHIEFEIFVELRVAGLELVGVKMHLQGEARACGQQLQVMWRGALVG